MGGVGGRLQRLLRTVLVVRLCLEGLGGRFQRLLRTVLVVRLCLEGLRGGGGGGFAAIAQDGVGRPPVS